MHGGPLQSGEGPAAKPGLDLARRLQVRHERHQSRSARYLGAKSRDAPAFASIIRDMASRAEHSLTAPSENGSTKVAACSSNSGDGPTIAIGSSMGGWISLLLAQRLRTKKLRGELAGSGADCAGCRLHRSPDVAALHA